MSTENTFATDRLFSLLLIVMAVIGYGMIGGMEEVYEPGEIQASTYPRIILACLIIACIFQIFKTDAPSEKAEFSLRGIAAIGIIAAYIALLETIGYFLLTPFVLIALPILVGFRNYKIIALSVVLVMAALYVVFGLILKIPLPSGLLGGF